MKLNDRSYASLILATVLTLLVAFLGQSPLTLEDFGILAAGFAWGQFFTSLSLPEEE